jgi:hypothetical protein
VVLVEQVLGVVVLVEKSQRNMRLGMLVNAYVLRRHAVFTQKSTDNFADMVAAGLRNHDARHTGTAERNNAVECGAARHGFLRLVVLEKDIQHRLADAYHTSFGRKGFWGFVVHHNVVLWFCKDTKYLGTRKEKHFHWQ